MDVTLSIFRPQPAEAEVARTDAAPEDGEAFEEVLERTQPPRPAISGISRGAPQPGAPSVQDEATADDIATPPTHGAGSADFSLHARPTTANGAGADPDAGRDPVHNLDRKSRETGIDAGAMKQPVLDEAQPRVAASPEAASPRAVNTAPMIGEERRPNADRTTLRAPAPGGYLAAGVGDQPAPDAMGNERAETGQRDLRGSSAARSAEEVRTGNDETAASGRRPGLSAPDAEPVRPSSRPETMAEMRLSAITDGAFQTPPPRDGQVTAPDDAGSGPTEREAAAPAPVDPVATAARSIRSDGPAILADVAARVASGPASMPQEAMASGLATEGRKGGPTPAGRVDELSVSADQGASQSRKGATPPFPERSIGRIAAETPVHGPADEATTAKVVTAQPGAALPPRAVPTASAPISTPETSPAGALLLSDPDGASDMAVAPARPAAQEESRVPPIPSAPRFAGSLTEALVESRLVDPDAAPIAPAGKGIVQIAAGDEPSAASLPKIADAPAPVGGPAPRDALTAHSRAETTTASAPVAAAPAVEAFAVRATVRQPYGQRSLAAVSPVGDAGPDLLDAPELGGGSDTQTSRGPEIQPRGVFAPNAPPPTPALRAVVDAIIAARDGDRVELRLDPPELGRVSIGIQLEDGALRAVVAADRPETLDLLRRHADALQRELNASGFGRADLSFADHRGGGRNGREAAGRIISESEEPVPAAATGPSTVVRPAGPSDRLDIRL